MSGPAGPSPVRESQRCLSQAARLAGSMMEQDSCRQMRNCGLSIMEAGAACQAEQWVKMGWECLRAARFLEMTPKGNRLSLMRRDAIRLNLKQAVDLAVGHTRHSL